VAVERLEERSFKMQNIFRVSDATLENVGDVCVWFESDVIHGKRGFLPRRLSDFEF
jgi:hypothetical protein